MARVQFSKLRVQGVVIPAGADLGIAEKRSRIAKPTVRLTWNGRPVVFGQIAARNLEVEISASHRWGPTLDGVDVGDEVVLESAGFEAALIPAGVDHVVLSRYPVPEAEKPCGYAVIAQRIDEVKARLDVTVAGKVVTLAAVQDVDVTVQYRALWPALVTGIDPGTVDTRAGTQSWGLTLATLS